MRVFLQKRRHKVWICSRLSFFLDWKVYQKICYKQLTCFNCKNFLKDVIKGGCTEELSVLHDVYVQTWMWNILECDPLYLCLQTFWDVYKTHLLVHAKEVSTSVPLERKKKTTVITNNIKADRLTHISQRWENAVLWTPGFCSFPVDSLRYVWGQKSKFTSDQMTDALAICNHSSWRAWKRHSITNSAMLSNAIYNNCWPLAFWQWIME